MSTDTPKADIEAEAQIWDAERDNEWENRLLRTRQGITSLAIHEASGAPPGFTQLLRPISKPAAVEQWNTLVTRDHRGHGLGLALKLANLALLAKVWPDAARVHTWNATENDQMWSINERLGYQTAEFGSGWQQRL